MMDWYNNCANFPKLEVTIKFKKMPSSRKRKKKNKKKRTDKRKPKPYQVIKHDFVRVENPG